MAVLQKLRTKFGLAISIIVGLGLLSFIIDPSQIESAVNSMSKKNDVGIIAGKRISYTDYQEGINKFTTINQILTGSSVQNEETQEQIRNAAWQELLDKYMFIKNAKEAGIRVGEAEMVDLTTGNSISPLIAQNPAFADENGNFSVDQLVNFVQQVDADETGNLRAYWNYLQNSVYTQQFYSKYASLFASGNYANALQVADDMEMSNTTANIDYVVAYYPVSQDTTIQVSSDEIKAFYKSHKEFFKQEANRDIEYVVFEVVPSSKDIDETQESIDAVYEEFGATDNIKTFLLKNSERQLSQYWYKNGELATINSDLDSQISAGAELTTVVRSGNSFFAARVMESKMVPDSAYVKHILLQGTDAKATADSLLQVIRRGENFANVAAAYSVDQNSAADGEIGNIGWMTQTYMISGFEGVLDAQVGQPFILNTQYGTHIVLVSKKTKPVLKKQIAVLEKTALASKETFNNYYAQANTFATIANGTYTGYQKALDSLKVYSHNMNITEATSSYGAISQAKEVTRWAFDNKAGKASNIITVNNNFFFVVAVKNVKKEGYADIKDLAPSIQSRLYSDKLQEKTLANVAEKIKGMTSLEQVAEALGNSIQTSEAVAFSTTGSSSVDQALVGAASKAQEGVVTGPVKGAIGVYVFSVSDKQKGEFYTEDDAKSLALQKAQYSSQMISSVMMNNDGVKDHRARFF